MIFHNNKGFTLIELVIGMAILSLILAGVGEILSTSLQSFRYSMEETSNVQDSRAALDRISSELRNATAITTPVYSSSSSNSGNRIDYTIKTDTAATENRSIYIGTSSDANTILINHNNGTVERFARNRVQSLEFIRDSQNKRKVIINITLKNQSLSSSPSDKLTTVVTTLNNIP